MNKLTYTYLGLLVKSVGKNGEIRIDVNEILEPELKKLKHVFIKYQGQFLPFFIEYVRLTDNDSLIKFDEIVDLEQANTLSGKEFYVTDDQINKRKFKKVFAKSEIQNFEVFDKDVFVGNVEEVIEYPSQVMVLLARPTGDNCLIPLVDDFIEDVDFDDKKLYLDLPEGLLDLNI